MSSPSTTCVTRTSRTSVTSSRTAGKFTSYFPHSLSGWLVFPKLNPLSIFFGKTKLTIRALGATPQDAQADGIDRLTPYLSGSVGLLFTSREPETIKAYFDALSQVDYARAGTRATRDFTVPAGVVYSTGGEVLAEHDVPVSHTLEPELRRLGVPTRMIRGKVVLGGDDSGDGSDGYVVCREGDVLDSRQTRLLKLFSVCMSEFRVQLLARWSAATGEVTELSKRVTAAAPAASAPVDPDVDAMSDDE